jgi:hypothetical protein
MAVDRAALWKRISPTPVRISREDTPTQLPRCGFKHPSSHGKGRRGLAPLRATVGLHRAPSPNRLKPLSQNSFYQIQTPDALSAFEKCGLERYGFWSMAHKARADFNMLLGAIYLLIVGAVAWSLDTILMRSHRQRPG